MPTPANMVLSQARMTGGQVGEDLGQIGPGVQENEKEDAGAAAEMAAVHRRIDECGQQVAATNQQVGALAAQIAMLVGVMQQSAATRAKDEQKVAVTEASVTATSDGATRNASHPHPEAPPRPPTTSDPSFQPAPGCRQARIAQPSHLTRNSKKRRAGRPGTARGPSQRYRGRL